jgi:hypothetical protein
MATMNNIPYSNSDDENFDDDASKVDSHLTWAWATWPANLRRATVLTVTIAIALAGLVALSRWADKDLGKQLQTQTNLKTQAQTRLKNSDQERIDIDKHLPLLRHLESQGIFGEEKRLEWIEQLRTIEKHWPGVKLQYAISAQNPLHEPASAPGAAPNHSQSTAASSGGIQNLLPNGQPAQSFGAFQSDMKLTLTVLHEGDVLAILDELKSAKLGRFNLKQCNFKRTNSLAPIDVECQLAWVSMKAYKPS